MPMAKPLAPPDAPPIPPSLRPSPLACAKEVCSEMCSYLAIKYPNLFRVTYAPLKPPTGEAFDIDATGNSFRQGERVKIVEMLETGEKWDLDVDDPMTVCGLLLQDDLAIMQEREDGQVYFVSGSVRGLLFQALLGLLTMLSETTDLYGRILAPGRQDWNAVRRDSWPWQSPSIQRKTAIFRTSCATLSLPF